MKAIVIIQARMTSTRLPGKMLMNVGGRPALDWVVSRASAIPGIDQVIVASPDTIENDPIAKWCDEHAIPCFRGSETDVLSRFFHAAQKYQGHTIMRLTGDCPFLDPFVCGQILALHKKSKAAYTSNIAPRQWPDGLDCEVFSFETLKHAHERATRLFDREHVTPYIRRNRFIFPSSFLSCPYAGLEKERWTLDTQNDLGFLNEIGNELNNKESLPTYLEILDILERRPDLRKMNQCDAQPGLYTPSVKNLSKINNFTNTSYLYQKTQKNIPLSSQTFSKSHIQYPEGKTPLFLTHGEGARIWDVDGNEYVDLVNGLLSVSLGYNDIDVNQAIERQLSSGISFSLATPLENELAELLIKHIPCAEQVRFGKNGTDVTSAAVRLARSFTKRDRIAVCGYHGWQDWYVGSTSRSSGVPKAVSELTSRFVYNDIESLRALFEKHPGEFAAVIMEPVTTELPKNNFLHEVQALCKKQGTLLIFDEVITGFRISLAGAQGYFGVTPDLACFGKSMANGMPISTLVGSSAIMGQMNEIFYSSTFGGETLSLAAAIATIKKMEAENVIDFYWQKGAWLGQEVEALITEFNVSEVIGLSGLAPWKILSFKDYNNQPMSYYKTLFLKSMIENSVLISGSHNISHAHTDKDFACILEAYKNTFQVLKEHSENPIKLDFPLVEPVFKVR